MATMLEEILGQLDDGNMGEIASVIGADGDTTKSAIELALPALLGGLAVNSSQPSGEAALAAALERDHDGSELDDIAGLIGTGGGPKAGRAVDHTLGPNREPVERQVAQSTGLPMGAISKLLPILIPIILAYLGRRQRAGFGDSGGLGSALGQEQRSMEQSGDPGLGPLFEILMGSVGGSSADGASAGGGSASAGGAGGLMAILAKLLGGRGK